jgi:PHD/YefM family antitoxin component YafN of YafNO toxin-antitoxin module
MTSISYGEFNDDMAISVNKIFEFGGGYSVTCGQKGTFVVIDEKEYIRMKEALGEEV